MKCYFSCFAFFSLLFLSPLAPACDHSAHYHTEYLIMRRALKSSEDAFCCGGCTIPFQRTEPLYLSPYSRENAWEYNDCFRMCCWQRSWENAWDYSDYEKIFQNCIQGEKTILAVWISWNEERIEMYKELSADKEYKKLYSNNDWEKKIEEWKKKIECRQKDIQKFNENYGHAIQAFERGLSDITQMFLNLYNACIANDHGDPKAFYERGRIFFDQGKTTEFLSDVNALIKAGAAKEYLEKENVSYLALGKGYSEANLYDRAIEVLTKAIEKNPENEEAYFERAIAYFETGDFTQALADYLKSNTHPSKIDPSEKNYLSYLKLAQGVGQGCIQGGCDSAIDFAPSLFSSLRGLSKGLWATISNPIEVSLEFVRSSEACIEFIKNNATPEMLSQIIPELREGIEKWSQWDDQKKGYLIGYIIGRYGIDTFAWGGCVKGMALYRNFKRANAVLTMETAIISPKQLNEVIVESEKFCKQRKEYCQKCYVEIGQQEKHIIRKNNFQKGGSELTISVEELESLSKPLLGSGVPEYGIFQETGYREYVCYEKIIGIYVSKDGKLRLPTTIGKVHYNKNGGFHVVPSDPKIIGRFEE